MSRRMEDVAKNAGVSVTTVSHVMNKTRFVAPETRKRVLNAIHELNYYKDAHARRLASGRSDFFGLIVSDIANPFFPEIIKSFETAALNRGFELMLCNTNYDPHRTQHAVRNMIENKVRGVAVMTSEFSPDLARELTLHRVAVVFLDQEEVQPYISHIKANYARGIFQAADHLYELGHRSLAYISGPQTLRSAVIRRKAFEDAMRQHGLEAGLTFSGNHRIEGGEAAAKSILKQAVLPTAVLCSNDLTAIGAMTALQREGVKIPADVSVVGFDDIYFARVAQPPLTTISLPRDLVGSLAFEALQKSLRSKTSMGAEYVVETQLVIRESTGRAKL